MPSKRKAEEDITVDEAPTSINPYTTLEVPTDASPDAIKSAYRKAALRHHPDKAAESDKETAHAKFQEIAFAYAILSDPRRRSRYDATGRTEESLDLDDDDFDWTTFFREQYAEVVTTEAIQKFAESYKGSEEERGHLLAAYTRYKGKMTKIYEAVMLSDVLEDEDRFRVIIDQAIQRGEVEDFENYSQESEKSRKARVTAARKQREKESKSVEEAKAEIESKKKKKGGSDGSMGDLAALIQQRQKGRADNFFDNLEAKYGTKGSKGKKANSENEPSEEAFAKNRAKGKSDARQTPNADTKTKKQRTR